MHPLIIPPSRPRILSLWRTCRFVRDEFAEVACEPASILKQRLFQLPTFQPMLSLETNRRVNMARRAVSATGLIFLTAATLAHAQQPGIQRKSLLQQDGPPGYQTIVNILEFAPGAREVRRSEEHTSELQ